MVIFKDKYTVLIFSGIIFCWYWFSFDMSYFSRPTSTLLLDRKGEMLGAKLASDGNWRFPKRSNYPVLFDKVIVQQEDEYFYYHPGFNPVSTIKALLTNIKKGRLSRGGSTISMQVIRMYRGYRERTILEKIIEFFLALRLEGHLSKKQIIQLYAFNAPFGSNISGLDAAAWKYFGIGSDELNLSQMTILALLPSSPDLIRPFNKQSVLKEKRNLLLARLHKNKIIDFKDFELAQNSAVPQSLLPMPNYAPHFLELVHRDPGLRGKLVKSSIDKNLQIKVYDLLQGNAIKLKLKKIYNGAIIVMDPYLGKPLAYVGNIMESQNLSHNQVDMIQASRSAGNILTPLLYASMLSDGFCIPDMVIPDAEKDPCSLCKVDSVDHLCSGLSVKELVSKSYNCSGFNLLKIYGQRRFYNILRKLGHHRLTKPYQHYGISIISGGSETSLWRLSCNYSSLVKLLQRDYFFDKPHYDSLRNSPFRASSIYLTFEALNKPFLHQDEAGLQTDTIKNIAWKSASGAKNRDAWAIGATPEYVVGLWLGNSKGDGNEQLNDLSIINGLMFDVFNYLKPKSWFKKPYDEMRQVVVCNKSGYRATSLCENKSLKWISKYGLKTSTCGIHN